MKRFENNILLAILALLGLAAARPAAAQYYIVTDLGTLGYPEGASYGLNNSGQVVGYSSDQNQYSHAFLWQGGVMAILGPTSSAAYGINDSGQVVGTTGNAFLWQGGVGTSLGISGVANAINSVGQVAGVNTAPGYSGGVTRAFVWQNGVYTNLGVLPGHNTSSAMGINNSGQAVGISGYQDPVNGLISSSQAFVWDPVHGMRSLGTLLGDTDCEAYAINDAGQVVGRSGTLVFYSADCPDCGDYYVWAPSNACLFTLDSSGGVVARTNIGYSDPPPTGINASGQVVGPGWVWDSAGGMRNVNIGSSGWNVTIGLAGASAKSAINDAGQIAAQGYINGQYHAVLLTPTATLPAIPPAPTNLTATAGIGQVSLGWTASSGATGYHVWRSVYGYTPDLIASPTTASYVDTSVTSGTVYYYVVSALNMYGESPNSNQASATTPTPPAAPSGLKATGARAKITLSWMQSTSPNVTKNKVYRSTTSGGGYSLLATLSATTSYSDTSVSRRVTYYYVVTAVNSFGQESAYSNQASAAGK